MCSRKPPLIGFRTQWFNLAQWLGSLLVLQMNLANLGWEEGEIQFYFLKTELGFPR